MTRQPAITLNMPSADATARFAARLGVSLRAGDVVLLDGPVGAGKSHLARALIQSRLAALGRYEDVPSPSYTLVQVYDLEEVDLWHADLYRLRNADDCLELGLDQAFEDAICLIEWPDRLGQMTPPKALWLRLGPGTHPDARLLEISAEDPRWADLIAEMSDFSSSLVETP